MDKDNKRGIADSLYLSSSRSTRVSLAGVASGRYSLSEHRQNLLLRVPHSGDYVSLEFESISVLDLAYLSAKTGDEFALLRSKHEDILFHGTSVNCTFTGELEMQIRAGKLTLIGHSHPGEDEPKPSLDDRNFLKEVGQTKSSVISARTGKVTDYTSNLFD